MKERPILFSAPMVRALLDGAKTQTRRVVKPQPIADAKFSGGYFLQPTKRTEGAQISIEAPYASLACPHGQPGDRLWVREAWSTLGVYDSQKPSDMAEHYIGTIRYMADGHKSGKLRPSIHMPRWASRITLEITSVRVERLQDISEADAIAEGAPWAACGSPQDGSHKAGYARLWESINGPDSWAANPWVWCIEFKRINQATP